MILSPRLWLRNLEESDIDAYARIFSDPGVAALDDYDLVTEETKLESFQEDDPLEVWTILLRDSNEIIGFCSCPVTDGVVALGYHLAPEHHGKGYAREAVTALLGSGVLGSRIEAHVDTRNTPSIRILETCGFQKTGEEPNLAGFTDWVYRWVPAS